MRWSMMHRAVAVVLVAVAAACGDSGGPVNSVTRFIARVTTLDTSMVAVLTRGAAPASGTGAAAIVAAPASVINGGSAQVHVGAGANFSAVVIFVFGYPDYYTLTLAAPDTAVDLIITISPSLNDATFNWRYAVGSSTANLGPYTDSPVNVVQVGSGDIQVSVSWDVESDVDLHLVEPGASGEEIYYGNGSSTAGGVLDLDSNPACFIDHVKNENITYPSSAPPHGTYTVRVDYFDECSEILTHYIVTVRVKGQGVQVFSGSFSGAGDNGGAGSGTTITTFSY